MRVLALIALAACSIPDKHAGSNGPADGSSGGDGSAMHDDSSIDAGGPYACRNQPLPTSAPGTITMTGTTASISQSGTQPLANVLVEGLIGGQSLLQVTSDANGQFSTQVPTGGRPIDGYLRASMGNSNYLVTYQYPSRPYDENGNVSLLLITQQTMSLVGTVAGVNVDSTKAQVVVILVDCNGVPLAGGTVVAPSGTVRYLDNGLPSQSATATDMTGAGFVINATPGAYAVQAIAPDGGTMRSHTVTAMSGTWTQAEIQP